MTSTFSRNEQGRDELAAFSHEAFFYGDPAGFVAGAQAFVEEGLAAGEDVMVALPAERLQLLRGALGADAARVVMADMADVGRNPARIIPAWRDFVFAGQASGRRVRGIGEPIWSGRGADELAECQLHEVLLNVAFDGQPAWRLLCPYDSTSLPPGVLDEARRSHPYVQEGGHSRPSDTFEARSGPVVLTGGLPDRPATARPLFFDAESLPQVRRTVAAWAGEALPEPYATDLVLAVHEIAANSVRHGGGNGRLHCWRDGDAFVCEVHDRGLLPRPLLGREIPPIDGEVGRGLWLANQLCDLVQLRTSVDGTVVRLRLAPR